jgi:hypothetical protein
MNEVGGAFDTRGERRGEYTVLKVRPGGGGTEQLEDLGVDGE